MIPTKTVTIDNRVTEYRTLGAQYSMFADELNEMIKYGWEPYGNMTVVDNHNGSITYCYILLTRLKEDDPC